MNLMANGDTLLIDLPVNDSVLLVSGDTAHFADRDEWRADTLTDRELTVLGALLDHVAAKVQHEQIVRRMGIRLATATPAEPR